MVFSQKQRVENSDILLPVAIRVVALHTLPDQWPVVPAHAVQQAVQHAHPRPGPGDEDNAVWARSVILYTDLRADMSETGDQRSWSGLYTSTLDRHCLLLPS